MDGWINSYMWFMPIHIIHLCIKGSNGIYVTNWPIISKIAIANLSMRRIFLLNDSRTHMCCGANLNACPVSYKVRLGSKGLIFVRVGQCI